MAVVLIEDNDVMRTSVCELLQNEGLTVITLSSAEELDDTPAAQSATVYLLDLNLPGEDGLSLTRRIRHAQPHARVIFLTARKDISDRVRGYDSGADLYMAKPAEPRELIAAVKSLRKQSLLSRRSGASIVVDTSQQCLIGPKGQAPLSLREARLLAAFATAANHSLEVWQVAEHFDIAGNDINIDSLRVRMSHLRKKLESVGASTPSIEAQRGKGYTLCIGLEITK